MHHLMYADIYVQKPAYLIFYSKTLPGPSMITPLYHEPLPPVRAYRIIHQDRPAPQPQYASRLSVYLSDPRRMTKLVA